MNDEFKICDLPPKLQKLKRSIALNLKKYVTACFVTDSNSCYIIAKSPAQCPRLVQRLSATVGLSIYLVLDRDMEWGWN